MGSGSRDVPSQMIVVCHGEPLVESIRKPMMPEALIEFRRCPHCRRTEIVETGEVIAEGSRHDRCGVEVESWVRFKAPSDWRPTERVP
jgi:hypothetical protein